MMNQKTLYAAPDCSVFESGAESLFCASNVNGGVDTLNDNVYDFSDIWIN